MSNIFIAKKATQVDANNFFLFFNFWLSTFAVVLSSMCFVWTLNGFTLDYMTKSYGQWEKFAISANVGLDI